MSGRGRPKKSKATNVANDANVPVDASDVENAKMDYERRNEELKREKEIKKEKEQENLEKSPFWVPLETSREGLRPPGWKGNKSSHNADRIKYNSIRNELDVYKPVSSASILFRK